MTTLPRPLSELTAPAVVLRSRLQNSMLFVLASSLEAFSFGCVLSLGAFFLWLP